MNTIPVEIQGTLHSDGTLELDQKPGLPPGRVKVILETLETVPPKRDPWTVLEGIWAERKALGLPSRSAEEIDRELNAMREEWTGFQD